jgi:hypothetical protein
MGVTPGDFFQIAQKYPPLNKNSTKNPAAHTAAPEMGFFG